MRLKPSLTTTIACLALFIALGGTAIATDRYIITNVSQIRPSVLRELRNVEALTAKAEPKGAKAIVARIRSREPIQTVGAPEEASIPLTGATWTQHAEQIDQLIGQITFTRNHTECPQEPVIAVRLNGALLETAQIGPRIMTSAEGETETRWLAFDGPFGNSEYLYEPGKSTPYVLALSAYDLCTEGGGTGHITIDSFSMDVIGVR